MNLATAIVVARRNSVRLPGKALLPFAGTTLIGHKVRRLLQCNLVGRVVVGSDSQEILDEAARHGATTVRRDDYHCDESRCSANEMIRDMVERVPGGDDDTFLWAHPTNPLVRPETYNRAIERYATRPDGFDSLCSVTVEIRHAWYGLDPLNHNPWRGPHRPASELRPVRFQDGAIFIQNRRRFLETSYFYGIAPLLHAIDRTESRDIDTPEDYRTALTLCELQSFPADHHFTATTADLTLASLSG